MAKKPSKQVEPGKKDDPNGAMRRAAQSALMSGGASKKKDYQYPVQPPEIPAGVVPKGKRAPVALAADSAIGNIPYNAYTLASYNYPGYGFPGFPYLSMLATRAEYRAFASTLSTEVCREWIKFTSAQNDGTDNSEKIAALEAEFKRLNVRGVIQKIAEHDCLFGRGQIFIGIRGADNKTPLVIDKRTIKLGSFDNLKAVEPIWTTPSAYNALDPMAPDFYKPSQWWVLGQQVHASRLYTLITRPLPDILKPAYNFAGMSLSQLAEPYVDNWLRTRQSVADLINNFSITMLKTDMGQLLQGQGDGEGLLDRAAFFTATRSNKGLGVIDFDREDLVQLNVPLGGLHELQAQSQEHICAASKIPAVILTGLSPSGLNATSEGEIKVFYDWIAANQEAFYREPIEIILKIAQISLFGEIDPDIGFEFIPLYQMTPKELSDIRYQNMQTATGYINSAVIDPQEVRENLARDPESGYDGIDAEMEIVPPSNPEAEGDPSDGQNLAQDSEFHEEDHPRADNGQFGSGGGGKPDHSKNKELHKTASGSSIMLDGGKVSIKRNGKTIVQPSHYSNYAKEEPLSYLQQKTLKDAGKNKDEYTSLGGNIFSKEDAVAVMSALKKDPAVAHEIRARKDEEEAVQKKLDEMAAKKEAAVNEIKKSFPEGAVPVSFTNPVNLDGDIMYTPRVDGENIHHPDVTIAGYVDGEPVGYTTKEKLNATKEAAAKKEKEKSDQVRKIREGKSDDELYEEIGSSLRKEREYDNNFNEGSAEGYNPHRERVRDIKWALAHSTDADRANVKPKTELPKQDAPQKQPEQKSAKQRVPISERMYLKVPYDDKEKAKAKGAKWDADKKKWYLPPGTELHESLHRYVSDSSLAMDEYDHEYDGFVDDDPV